MIWIHCENGENYIDLWWNHVSSSSSRVLCLHWSSCQRTMNACGETFMKLSMGSCLGFIQCQTKSCNKTIFAFTHTHTQQIQQQQQLYHQMVSVFTGFSIFLWLHSNLRLSTLIWTEHMRCDCIETILQFQYTVCSCSRSLVHCSRFGSVLFSSVQYIHTTRSTLSNEHCTLHIAHCNIKSQPNILNLLYSIDFREITCNAITWSVCWMRAFLCWLLVVPTFSENLREKKWQKPFVSWFCTMNHKGMKRELIFVHAVDFILKKKKKIPKNEKV